MKEKESKEERRVKNREAMEETTDERMRQGKREENKKMLRKRERHAHRFGRGSTLRDLFSSALVVPVELPSVFWKLGHCSSHSACLIRHVARLFSSSFF